MNQEELVAIFDNDKTTQGYMFRDDPTSLIDVWETDKLLEIKVKMKGGQEITIFYGDRTEYIDLSSHNEESYVGLGSTLISPRKDIESIDVKWR